MVPPPSVPSAFKPADVVFQALTDQQMYEKADGTFKKAVSIEPDNGNIYVHRGSVDVHFGGRGIGMIGCCGSEFRLLLLPGCSSCSGNRTLKKLRG